jgi:hypothetical protein
MLRGLVLNARLEAGRHGQNQEARTVEWQLVAQSDRTFRTFMSYRYDTFLSYPRAGATGEWVRNHFRPVLEECLDLEMLSPPAIWYDEDQRPGLNWPLNLQRRSFTHGSWSQSGPRLISVRPGAWRNGRACSPANARLDSPPCRTRSASFIQWFSLTASTSHRKLATWGIPFPQFQKTAEYQEFWARMRKVATEIASHLSSVPPWSPGWPVLTPPIAAAPQAPLPRL